MTISADDINFYYSGGTNNIDSSKSIGGKASINLIQGISNNLFNDITDLPDGDSRVDYRCFYIFNTSELYSFYDTSIYVLSQSGINSSVELGISKKTEIQNLNIALSGSPASGNFKLRYEDLTTDSISYSNDPSILASNIQKELNRLTVVGEGDFSGLVVNYSSNSNYLIYFQGSEDNRNHPNLIPTDINITPSASMTISNSAQGQPINSEAPLLPNSITDPFGVSFYTTSESSKLSIGDLRPGDGVPIWLKRTSFGTTDAIINKEFQLRLSGKSISS